MIWVLGVPGVWFLGDWYGLTGVRVRPWTRRHLGLGLGLYRVPLTQAP